jgi:hypothetical protein
MYATMPWGKFKGKPLSAIDDAYLTWVLHEAEAAKPWLKQAVEAELSRRGCAEDPSPGAVVHVKEIVRRWFREMSLKYHPDRGGSENAMRALNHAHERLRELLGVKG